MCVRLLPVTYRHRTATVSGTGPGRGYRRRERPGAYCWNAEGIIGVTTRSTRGALILPTGGIQTYGVMAGGGSPPNTAPRERGDLGKQSMMSHSLRRCRARRPRGDSDQNCHPRIWEGEPGLGRGFPSAGRARKAPAGRYSSHTWNGKGPSAIDADGPLDQARSPGPCRQGPERTGRGPGPRLSPEDA